MHLASRLRDTTLGDLLAALYREGASGVLEILEPHARHAIHLRRGFVQAVESETPTARLGDVAVRANLLPRVGVERARMMAHARGLRLGQAMIASRLVTPSQLDGLLRRQRTERLERLYALGDAELRFRVSRPLPGGAVEQAPLFPSEVFHGRPRRSKRSTSGHAKTAPKGSAHTARADHLAVLGLCAAASDADARVAFRRLALELHPDRHPHTTRADHLDRTQKFAAVVAAYRALTSDDLARP